MITKRQLKNPQMFGKELGNTQFCTVYKPLFKAWCESEHVIASILKNQDKLIWMMKSLISLQKCGHLVFEYRTAISAVQ